MADNASEYQVFVGARARKQASNNIQLQSGATLGWKGKRHNRKQTFNKYNCPI
jgi:hypothetical protein